MSCGRRLGRLIHRLEAKQFGPLTERLRTLHDELAGRDVARLGAWISELEYRTSSLEDILDILAQGEAAALFAANDFHVTMDPLSGRGPDLKLVDAGYVVYVEVKRLRAGCSEKAEMEKAQAENRLFMLDATYQVTRMHEAIAGKNKQGADLPFGSIYIVYIRSDAIAGFREFEWAIKYIEKVNEETPTLLKNIGGVMLDIGHVEATLPLWEESNPRDEESPGMFKHIDAVMLNAGRVELQILQPLGFWLNERVRGTCAVGAMLASRLKNLTPPTYEEGRQFLADLERYVAEKDARTMTPGDRDPCS